VTHKSSLAERRVHGVEIGPGGAWFRIWAPGKRRAGVVLGDGREIGLASGEDGWFGGHVPGAGPGTRYGFRLDGGDTLADPASRWQPDGPDGLSEIADASFPWTDGGWPGIGAAGQVICELHVGTFTEAGTWAAATDRLGHLAEVGVTVVELMPVGAFRGRFGWGYDGALWYAPTQLYGPPDAFRGFVDAAHACGIGVILDVVYNHFGPGNRFHEVTEHWFTDRYRNDWGRSLNFDGPHCGPVRAYVAENAAYWIGDFHLDGLRLDATQALMDASDEHIVARIARAARQAAGPRRVLLIGENEPQEARFARPLRQGGHGLDALWNDDFHHSARVALTGRSEAYYHDHRGAPQEFVAAAKFGHLFQGQRYDWQDAARGTPSRDLPATAFVNFLENHDQVANTVDGARAWAMGPAARMRALTALLLLLPQTPMLFQGQEFASSRPFLYFADQGELDREIADGRADFLAQFASGRDPAVVARLPFPAAPDSFACCKLDWDEVARHGPVVALHRDLLRLRRETPAFARQPAGAAGGIDGAVIGPQAFLLRYVARPEAEERLLLANLGPDLRLSSIPDPLFAPPAGTEWRLVWSSEHPDYGGGGRREIDARRRFTLPADSVGVFAPARSARRTPPEDLSDWQDRIG
jgi:maltooligosyltrehalose trehalohydrolase